MNKKIISFFIVLFSLLFSILIVSSSLMFIPTHSNEQGKMDKAIMQYLFNPFSSSKNIIFLSTKETQHLEEVKSYLFTCLTLLILLGVFLMYKIRKRKDQKQIYYLSSKIMFYTVAILTAASLLAGFNNLWTLFHYVFFPQGNWVFSEKSTIIGLYGENYFLFVCMAIIVLFLTQASALYVMSKRKS